MPKSGSTFTAAKLSEITSIRTHHLVPLTYTYGVVEAEIDIGILVKAMSQNRNSSFVLSYGFKRMALLVGYPCIPLLPNA